MAHYAFFLHGRSLICPWKNRYLTCYATHSTCPRHNFWVTECIVRSIATPRSNWVFDWLWHCALHKSQVNLITSITGKLMYRRWIKFLNIHHLDSYAIHSSDFNTINYYQPWLRKPYVIIESNLIEAIGVHIMKQIILKRVSLIYSSAVISSPVLYIIMDVFILHTPYIHIKVIYIFVDSLYRECAHICCY